MARSHQETYRNHIIAAGSSLVTNSSCYVAGIIISASPPVAGTISIVDHGDNVVIPNIPVFTLVPVTTLPNAIPNSPWVIDLIDTRAYMHNGISIVTNAITGNVDVWVLCTDVPTSY